MKIAIITTAGISSRFNEGIPESEKKLKGIFFENDFRKTLLYHLLKQCIYADKIIIVGGYKFESLKEYCACLESKLKNKIILVYNDHYDDLASGYSLYLGLNEAFQYDVDDIIFAEGDLDFDIESFRKVIESGKSTLTYTFEPIYANKAVVLYKDIKNRYRYAFNSEHGLLTINEPFSCVLNSGQVWKFTEMAALHVANEKFYKESKSGTNLQIIQNYLDTGVEIELVAIKRWTNCNTRMDYSKIIKYWEEKNEIFTGKVQNC